MSLPKPDVHIRLSPECFGALNLLAEIEQCHVSALVTKIVEEAVLGRFHVVKVAAREVQRLGIGGSGDAG